MLLALCNQEEKDKTTHRRITYLKKNLYKTIVFGKLAWWYFYHTGAVFSYKKYIWVSFAAKGTSRTCHVVTLLWKTFVMMFSV